MEFGNGNISKFSYLTQTLVWHYWAATEAWMKYWQSLILRKCNVYF